jgi:antitoxin ParD1/3/4
MSQLNVSMPPTLRQWIEARVAEGRYSSASDYVRDLVRRDQETALAENEWLRAALAEGMASGLLAETPRAVLDSIVSQRRAGSD